MHAADILIYGQRTFLQSTDSIPASSQDLPGACGTWSVKDIIAHLASFEQVLVDILAGFVNASSGTALQTFIDTGNQFNDSEVSKRKDQSYQLVLTELSESHAKSLSLLALIPPELCRQTGTLPWYGASYSLDDVIVYMYYGHKREHSAQIDLFLTNLRA
ncbi:hypothetical protein KDA_58570 [Dictyobacter alpinus]|uniref:DinB-like domain-containing protein n=1 Tax=Dictyobacter alpinus TaxID=2014873 RepID=A0A402BG70_9CHLR|nr:DinB family protein [Dictyobacter alpinus]GCE30373.1 hypothetical protein KDA_58570 [Dictyobacter alpinus]